MLSRRLCWFNIDGLEQSTAGSTAATEAATATAKAAATEAATLTATETATTETATGTLSALVGSYAKESKGVHAADEVEVRRG